MSLEVETEPVTGGYRIVDTDRHEGYQGVATVTQRDAHPIVFDCLISHDEALERAKIMAAAPDLLSLAKRWLALDGQWHSDRYESEKAELLNETRALIAKVTE